MRKTILSILTILFSLGFQTGKTTCMDVIFPLCPGQLPPIHPFTNSPDVYTKSMGIICGDSIQISNPPEHGTVTIIDTIGNITDTTLNLNFLYQPLSNCSPTDTFEIKIYDDGDSLACDSMKYILHFEFQCETPDDLFCCIPPNTDSYLDVFVNDSAFIEENYDVSISTIEVEFVTDFPENGMLVQQLVSPFDYSPNAGFTGLDSFSYRVKYVIVTTDGDTIVICDEQTCYILVEDCLNMMPDGYCIAPGDTICIDPLANDTVEPTINDPILDALGLECQNPLPVIDSLTISPQSSAPPLFTDGNCNTAFSSLNIGTSIYTYEVCTNLGACKTDTIIVNVNNDCEIENWSKIYGDTLENKPTTVKAIGGGLYVAGTVSINGDLYPTMSKFDITNGTLLWETQIDSPGEIKDFEDGNNGNIIAVGRTIQPGVTGNHDNTSFILKFDNSGSIIGQKVYDLNGRETFNRILRHKAPENTAYPYYILGAKNPVGGAIYRDVCFLINLDANLNVNWFTDYENSTEMEIMFGLVDLSSGDLLIMGVGGISAPNDGLLLKVDGQTGAIQIANFYPHGLDLYDGIEMPDGNIMLSGTKFLPNLDATLFVVDGTQYLPVGTGITFPDIDNFRNVWVNQSGEFFTIGEQNDSTPNLHVVHRVELDNTGNLNVLYRGTIEDGEQEFSKPNIFTSPEYNTVFYADGRRYNHNGFGDYDMLVGVFANSENCVNELPDSSQPYTYTAGTFSPTMTPYSEPEFTTPLGTSPMGYLCRLFCDSTSDSTCLYFDGNDDKIQSPGTGLNTIGTGDFTFEAQVRGQETGQVSHPAIFSNRVSTSGGVLFFLANWSPAGPNRVLSVQLGGTNYLILNNGTYNASLLDGECHHVAVTRQGTLLSFYIGGTLIGTKTLSSTLSVTSGDLVIGGDNVSNNAFEGHISDVRIWNTALTANQIQTNSTATLTGSEPNLLANWKMNEGIGQTVFDISPNAYNGVLGSNSSEESTDPNWNEDCCEIPVCIDVQIYAHLEGAYDSIFNEMDTTALYMRGILPGQTPVSSITSPTPAGHPYNTIPWNYCGTEGIGWTDTNYTPDVVDWVLVSFRTGTAKDTEVDKAAALLYQDGSIAFPDCCPLTTSHSSLYIVIEHRNHMGVMTPTPVNIVSGTLMHDFRAADSYRNPASIGQKQLPNGTWVMVAGDANPTDNISYDINGGDKVIWESQNGTFDNYTTSDMNLDADVNGIDKTIWLINNGTYSAVPK